MISTTIPRIALIFSLCFLFIRAGPKSIPDEELDWNVNGSLTEGLHKYKYVLIAFLRIADSKKTTTRELKGIKFCSPNEDKIMKENKFSGLVQTARNLLTRYEKVLLKTTDYATVAYNYRLLEWLKFSMREGDEKNEELEGDIVNIENNLEKNSGKIFLELSYLREKQFLKAVSFKYEIEKKSREIKNLAQLKQFGTEQDQVVGFLRLLGTIEEEAVENNEITMPFPNNLTAYENLIHAAGLYSNDFRIFFKKDILQILRKLYRAISVRLDFSNHYKSIDVKNIRLPDTVTDNVKYTCEVMTLFNRAIEEILQDLNKSVLSNKYDSELQIVFNRERNRRIENYYVDEQMLDELRTDVVETKDTFPTRSYNRVYAYSVLLRLIREVVSKYDEFIKRIDKELPAINTTVAMSDLPDAFVVYYGRIIGWLNGQMKKIETYGEGSKLYEVLADILKSRRSGSYLKLPSTYLYGLPDSLNYDRNMSEDEYLKVTTMDELHTFFMHGRSRPAVQSWGNK